jgi:thioredoxin-like negative regulator of GroEL
MSWVCFRPDWRALIGCALLTTMPVQLFAKPAAAQPSLEEIGSEIATVLNERDQQAFVRMLDLERLAYRIAATMYDSEKERQDYVRGFSSGGNADKLTRVLFAQLKNQEQVSAKFMRVVERHRDRRLLVRIDLGDMGFDYAEYVVERDALGVSKIVDWYTLSGGELISTSVGALSRLVLDPAPAFLKTLFGLQTIDQETVRRMRHISDLRVKGQFKEAYSEMDKLPPEIAGSRIILTQRVALASASGDEAMYRAALEQLAQRYADQPEAAFMLIDHHMYKQDYERCLKAIGNMEERVGVDGLTHMLRANINVLANRLDDAARSAREGVRAEPDFAGVRFTLVDILIAQEHFDEAVTEFRTLESDFGYEFSREALHAQPTYAKFVVSPAFKQWQD